MGNSIKINWRKFWHEFDVWCDDQDPFFGGKSFPEWNQQARAIGRKLTPYFPTLNRRKLWRNFDKKCEDSSADWNVQKRWIRKLIQKQIKENTDG